MAGAHDGDVMCLIEVRLQFLERLGRVDGVDGANRGQLTRAQQNICQRLDAGGLAELACEDFQIALGQGLHALGHGVQRLGP